MLAINPTGVGETPGRAGEQSIGSKMGRMKENSPLKVVATSRSPSSEMEDEECKVGIEGREGIPVIRPVNPETGGEGAAVWIPQEERVSIQQYAVNRCSKVRGE